MKSFDLFLTHFHDRAHIVLEVNPFASAFFFCSIPSST